MTPSAIDPLHRAGFLRAQAAKARRLAQSVGDERVVTALTRYATELEERALELEAAGTPSRDSWGGLEY